MATSVARSGGACGGGRAAAGGQGSGSSGHAGNFQKITTSDLRHFVFPLYFYKNIFVRCGTIRTLLHRKQNKKRFRPQRAYTHKDESVKLPWYHLGLLSPHRDSLTAAAFCNATTGRCNGRSRRRLSTLALRPRGSETIFSSLFPALFHRPGSLEGSMRKPTLLFTAIFVILHT